MSTTATPAPNTAPFRDLVDAAIGATFGAQTPAWVDELVDRKVAGELLDDAKLGFVFGGAAPRLVVSSVDEEERLMGYLEKVSPASRAFLNQPHIEFYVDTDGTDYRILMPQEEADGIIGRAFRTTTGATQVLRLLADVPANLSGSLAKAAAFAGEGGDWVAVEGDGGVEELVWTLEDIASTKTAEFIAGLLPSDAAKATAAALTQEGHRIATFSMRFTQGGEPEISLWSIKGQLPVGADLPDIFQGTKAPTHADVAEAFRFAFLPAHHAEALPYLRDTILPGLAAKAQSDNDLEVQAIVYRALFGMLAGIVPPERLQAIQTLGRILKIDELNSYGRQLAVARYLGSHPDAAPPASVTLGPDLELATQGDLLEQAQRAQSQLTELLGGQTQADLDVFATSLVPISIEETTDLLNRTVSGDFTAATGFLHDWFVELGPGGYDDDPDLASLDDIDMEAGGNEAAIEEALAWDDDEDF